MIGAPSETAPLSARIGALKIQRECLSYTVDDVASHPACAALVAQGKLSGIIPVASRTALAPRRDAMQAATALVEKAMRTDPHPAGDYLLGNFYGTGERMKPDYPRAIGHLQRAVEGGNAAAADLLGTFYLSGKGVPQDARKAAALYEMAAAGGMKGSVMRLAALYLDGRWFPKDTARAEAILESAKAAGHAEAGTMLILVQGERNIHNVQLLPRGEGAAPELREYKTFDNPAIPPALGFTDELQKLYYSAYSDPAVTARLERDYPTLPTPYIYELARRIAGESAEKGRGYWMLARLRTAFDARRCQDPGAMQALNAWDRLVIPDIRHTLLGMSPAETKAAVEFALQREAALPGNTRPWWLCYSSMQSYMAATEGKPVPLLLRPEAEWPALRAEEREKLKALLTSPLAR